MFSYNTTFIVLQVQELEGPTVAGPQGTMITKPSVLKTLQTSSRTQWSIAQVITLTLISPDLDLTGGRFQMSNFDLYLGHENCQNLCILQIQENYITVFKVFTHPASKTTSQGQHKDIFRALCIYFQGYLVIFLVFAEFRVILLYTTHINVD